MPLCLDSCKPSRAPLLTGSFGGVISFERQAHEQLPSTQLGPLLGCRIQRNGEVVGFSHKVTRSARRHLGSVA